MKIAKYALLTLALSWATAAQAQFYYGQEEESAAKNQEENFWDSVSHEVDSEYSYTGKSQLKQGTRKWGRMDSHHSAVHYVASAPVAEGVILRLGGRWEMFNFGVPGGSPMPNTLQTAAAIVGADFELADDWVMRLEVEPGIYSDFKEISFDDVNMPIVLGASYLVSKDLQWFFGINANPRRGDLPIIPAAGVRWKFADEWTLNLLFPNPRIEYEVAQDVVLFAGAAIRGGSFQLSENQNRTTGRTDLDNDNVTYWELRAGAGVEWEFAPGWKLGADAGWTVDRRLRSEQSSLTLDSEGAPYGHLKLSASF